MKIFNVWTYSSWIWTILFIFTIVNAQKTCGEGEFTCDNNRCIANQWVCDQKNDCSDMSDEKNCSNNICSDTEFRCKNGQCISQSKKCNGYEDCADKSDETDCVVYVSHCGDGEFKCHNNEACISNAWQCDSEADCSDGSDELNCNNTCRPDQFQCKDLHCIIGHMRCDGEHNCLDGSDEEDCPEMKHSVCNETQFDCGGNTCIPLRLVCDGNNDCGSWEDEPIHNCNKTECSNNNGGCSQKCIDSATGYHCDCFEGYELVNKTICKDVNECDIPGSCSHICINEVGSFKCECLNGYEFETNNKHRCVAADGHLTLIFASENEIRKLDLTTEEYVPLVRDVVSGGLLDYVYRRGTLIWMDAEDNTINSAPITTRSPVMSVKIFDAIMVEAITVDWIYGHIYWKNSTSKTIDVVDITRKIQKTLVKEVNGQSNLAVNPLEGLMFWTDWESVSGRIECAGMDGSNRKVIVNHDITWPNGIAIDFVSKRIFWSDAKLHILSSTDYNGGHRIDTLVHEMYLLHPNSIDVFEDWFYWTALKEKTVQKVNKFTGKEMKNISIGVDHLMGLHVYHPYKQPNGTNYCEEQNAQCSHFCLPVPSVTLHAEKYLCACPDGMTLQKDLHTCILESYNNLPSTTIVPSSPDEFTSNNSTETKGSLVSDTGKIAGIIIGVLGGLAIVTTMVAFFMYKHYLHRNVASMNFDNPVYRKTTEDQFNLEKNQYRPAHSYPPSMEPLTSPGTNEFV